jgi:capsular exopolysaccharide synthesis family protein
MIQISAQHTDRILTQALTQTTAEVFIAQKTVQQASRYQDSLEELEAQVKKVEEELQRTRIQIATFGNPELLTPLESAELARLETELNNDQIRLGVLLRSTEDFRLDMVRYSNYISIFSSAVLPKTPVGPRVMRNTALAAVVGAMGGIGIAFLLEYLDDTLHSPEEVQVTLGLSTLAAIPKLKDFDLGAVITREEPLHPVSEAFRNLRTSIQFADLDSGVRTLLITSPTPNEGKSFVAANLAVTIAQGGKNVVLLDTDLRHPTIHHIMGTEKNLGLSNLLYTISEEGNIFDRFIGIDAYFQTAGEDINTLSILSSGKSVPNPAEVLNSQLFHDLITWLHDRYDAVVIDSAPLLAVTDAAIVATQVDGVALVVNAGETRVGAVLQSIDRLNSVGAKLLGVIINQVSSERGGYYYYNQYPYGENGDSHGRRRISDRILPIIKRIRNPEAVGVEEPYA